jgi:hypothetical protein
MGFEDGTVSVRLNVIFCPQDWFLGFPSVGKPREAEQLSASISVRWEPDGIFAYHSRNELVSARQRSLNTNWTFSGIREPARF